MIEAIIMFLNEMFDNPLGGEGNLIFGILLLVLGFPSMFLSLAFYQLPISEGISKKQLFLNNVNLFFMIAFLILLFSVASWKYFEIITTFLAFIPPLIFLYLKIFKKQNYVFYNLINLWWVLFWCISVSKMQYFYGVILVYLIVFFYKQMLILILLFINITGLYLLHFYNIYIFNWLVFYFVIFFPFIVFFFSFIKLFKENNEPELDKFDTNKKIHKEQDKDK